MRRLFFSILLLVFLFFPSLSIATPSIFSPEKRTFDNCEFVVFFPSKTKERIAYTGELKSVMVESIYDEDGEDPYLRAECLPIIDREEFIKNLKSSLEKYAEAWGISTSQITIEDGREGTFEGVRTYLGIDLKCFGKFIIGNHSVLGLVVVEELSKFPSDKTLFFLSAASRTKRGLSAVTPTKARLFVHTFPEGARVRIMNIVPVFHQGIELEPGRYHIEVSAMEYKTQHKWVSLEAGEEKYIEAHLESLAVIDQGKPTRNCIGMEFAYIPPGSFMMGSQSNERGRGDDERQHRVTISRGFYLQTTEVTVGQWQRFMQATGYKADAENGCLSLVLTGSGWEKRKDATWANPGFSQNDSHPITCLSWNDAQKFVGWLNQQGDGSYRLPTEAEWEYAARAGSTTRFCFGNDDFGLAEYAWCLDNSRGKTHPVSQKKANDWGLYDMHGNVWEWCQDWFKDYPSGAVIDPVGPPRGYQRVGRGGGWNSAPAFCRSARRSGGDPSERFNFLGFRILKEK